MQEGGGGMWGGGGWGGGTTGFRAEMDQTWIQVDIFLHPAPVMSDQTECIRAQEPFANLAQSTTTVRNSTDFGLQSC